MKIIPSRGYCLIEPLDKEEMSSGGVYVPERVKDLPQKGKVLAVGEVKTIYDPNRNIIQYAVALPCEVGDTVIFKRFVDNRIKEDGKELLLVKFDDILAIYEEKSSNSSSHPSFIDSDGNVTKYG